MGLVSTAVPQYLVQLLLHPTPVVGARMLGRVCVGAHTKDEKAHRDTRWAGREGGRTCARGERESEELQRRKKRASGL